jgi:hypothetical protein
MKSSALARRAAAFGASATVLAALVAGMAAGPAQAATTQATASATSAAGKAEPKVSVTTPKAATRDYEGTCPVEFGYSAKVKVKVTGKTQLVYRWLHGDGSKSKVKTVKLSGHGTKYVKVAQKLSFKDDVKKGWEAVQVLSPRKVTSKKGYFSVTCSEAAVLIEAKGPEVSARAWASPSSFTGSCTPSPKISFNGVIKVAHPSWVKYRWVVNGKAVDYGRIKVRSSRQVSYGYTPRGSEQGYAVLQVLGPNGASSDRAGYKVLCKHGDHGDHPSRFVRVSATDLVTATNNDGCKVGAHADVNASGRARVEYVWSVNGSSVSKGAVAFNRAGSQTVSLSDQALSGAAAKGGRVTLAVSGPRNGDSISQSYAACKPPAPKVSVSGLSASGQRDGFCADGRGPGVDFSATISSTAPTTVKYYWTVNGKRENPDLVRQVNGSVNVTWGIAGASGSGETKGSVSLVVYSPDSASASTAFAVSCPKPDEKGA